MPMPVGVSTTPCAEFWDIQGCDTEGQLLDLYSSRLEVLVELVARFDASH